MLFLAGNIGLFIHISYYNESKVAKFNSNNKKTNLHNMEYETL